ncbi:MAG: transposase [Myxococcales bacterium]|nr:transposase [Myxococcales bacterium]
MLYEFKRQLTYRVEERGGQIYTDDRFFPSSKVCSSCGYSNNNLTVNDRTRRTVPHVEQRVIGT